MLWANAADDKLIFFIFFLETGSDTSCKLSLKETIFAWNVNASARKNMENILKYWLLRLFTQHAERFLSLTLTIINEFRVSHLQDNMTYKIVYSMFPAPQRKHADKEWVKVISIMPKKMHVYVICLKGGNYFIPNQNACRGFTLLWCL